MSETLPIKVSSAQKARIDAVASARKVPVSELIRESLRKVLSETGNSGQLSLFELFAKKPAFASLQPNSPAHEQARL
jgi:hypothetical protein